MTKLDMCTKSVSNNKVVSKIVSIRIVVLTKKLTILIKIENEKQIT